LIVPDTSIWIDLLSLHPKQLPTQDQLVRFVTCGPIIQEVLQGLRPHPSADSFREAFLALPRISDPLRIRTFLHGAEIYQLGRAKGLTIRSSADCLIAAIAIENRIPVWHKDRDFSTIARFTSLRAVTRLESVP
jgi:predicted nucleic acid-binding protein